MTSPSVEASVIDTAHGPVELVVEGSGPPILYFHGTLSGMELALSRDRTLISEGFRLIVPHRPGFYRTPLQGRTTPADTADLATAVLDHFGIDRVALIGTSAGGLPALAFAIRHPQRTAALVLQCAQTHRWDGPEWAPPAYRWMYRWVRRPPTRWLFWRLHSLSLSFSSVDRCLRNLVGGRFSEVQNDPAAVRMAEAAYRELRRIRLHRDGYYNDLTTFTRQDVLSAGNVTCPTLIFHDPLDPIAPLCHAEYAARRIAGSELVRLHAGGHLIWAGRDAQRMQQRRTAFLQEHLGRCESSG